VGRDRRLTTCFFLDSASAILISGVHAGPNPTRACEERPPSAPSHEARRMTSHILSIHGVALLGAPPMSIIALNNTDKQTLDSLLPCVLELFTPKGSMCGLAVSATDQSQSGIAGYSCCRPRMLAPTLSGASRTAERNGTERGGHRGFFTRPCPTTTRASLTEALERNLSMPFYLPPDPADRSCFSGLVAVPSAAKVVSDAASPPVDGLAQPAAKASALFRTVNAR
jgi:hypothetical protein